MGALVRNTVVARTPLDGVPEQRVWAAVRSVAEHAGHVLAVSATPEGDERWSVLLNGSRVDWVQRNHPVAGGRMRFDQVSGDLAELGGTWSVADGVLGLDVEFHLGVDGLAPLLDPIWAQSFQAHADALVRAVAAASREGDA
ncbi:SRPBCC family protein [Actinosynnema sp. NPDC020468]|uniref:SRPBCC family protein n=1 Tax=Actinosynnema sp. NPDC020468 TaxID=3154488 RepID=UPI00340C19EC